MNIPRFRGSPNSILQDRNDECEREESEKNAVRKLKSTLEKIFPAYGPAYLLEKKNKSFMTQI